MIAGDKLDKKDTCLGIGVESYSKMLSKSVSETGDKLLTKLQSLKENGKTALGPALAAALGLASQGKPGSTVILCTDGIANVGVGELDSSKGVNDTFYEEMGVYAKERGVLVNVITIKGEGSKIEKLGQISDLTQGKVIRVNPDNITQDFANVMKEVVIGTQVDVKIRLHPALKFRNEEEEYLSENRAVYLKNVGNVTVRTTLTFEYQNKTDTELQQQGIALDKLKEVPLQATITYTSSDGNRILRIVTKNQILTEDLKVAEKDVKFKILATRACQGSALLAAKGSYRQAQASNDRWDQYLSSNAVQNSESSQKGMGAWKAKNSSMKQVIESRASRKTEDRPNISHAQGMNQPNNVSSTGLMANLQSDQFAMPESKASYSFPYGEKVSKQEEKVSKQEEKVSKKDEKVSKKDEKVSKKQEQDDAEASDDENVELFQNKQANCDEFE